VKILTGGYSPRATKVVDLVKIQSRQLESGWEKILIIYVYCPGDFLRGFLCSTILSLGEIIILEGFFMMSFNEQSKARAITKIGILSGIAFVLMLLDFPLGGMFPTFLQIDFSDMPALLGGFALGPLAGIIIELIKNILHAVIRGTHTALVGEVANFVVGATFVFIASFMYHRKKTFKTALLGMLFGTIAMSLVAAVANYYVLIPFYAKLFNTPIDKFVMAANKVNGSIVSFKTLIWISVVPFNLIKGLLESIVTLGLYKKVSPVLHS
jgi:riboflavin transporter FmnP